MTKRARHSIAWRIWRDRRGSPALEFALIAPLFFAAVFGTFELGRALYERNRVSSAAAIAMRTISLDRTASDTTIENAIKAKLNGVDPTDLTITITPVTIADQSFKKIEITYKFDLLVKFGHAFSSFDLHSTRYMPIVS